MTTKNTQNKVEFSPDQLRLALFFVENLLERISTPFVVLGEMADCLKNNKQLKADKVIVGVRALELMPTRRETMKQFMGKIIEETNTKIVTEFEGVPVIIKLYKIDYGFLTNPDTVGVEYGHWKVPNNFEKYWKMRHLVR